MGRRLRGKRRLAARVDDTVHSLQQTEFIRFSGPIPSPMMLRAYGEVIDNGAERVFRMAEEQGKHRRALERIDLIGGVTLHFMGLSAALLLCAALAYGGWLLAREGRSLFGIAAIILALGTPAGAFVYGRRSPAPSRPDSD